MVAEGAWVMVTLVVVVKPGQGEEGRMVYVIK